MDKKHTPTKTKSRTRLKKFLEISFRKSLGNFYFIYTQYVNAKFPNFLRTYNQKVDSKSFLEM